MKKAALAFAVASALFSTGALAWSTTDCGCGPAPKPVKMKSNAGVGNGSEGGPTEAFDRDPGNSGANNQAGTNVGKPRSPNATNVIP
jgi:hypothetical protein